MLIIKSPELYINEFGILKEAGKYITAYGKKAFLIAGRTAWKSVRDELEKSLQASGIEYNVKIMEGYPTYERVKSFASDAYQYQADVVVGIGGGKICDVAKAVGNFRNVPLVMIPTIPATCACWAARSILYTEDGNFDFIQWNKTNTKLILADTGVLMKAPKRYLASGIVDTLAKWYEFEPLIATSKNDVILRQDVAIAELAFRILKELGGKAMKNQVSEDEQKQIIDAIIFLAGATGSFSSGKAYRGLAHPYYFTSTRIPESRYLLHGEKVAFGLLVQFLLANKDKEFIDDYLNDLVTYQILDTPKDWNTADTDKTIHDIAELLMKEWPVLVEKGFVNSAEEAEKAIHEASTIIEQVKKNR